MPFTLAHPAAALPLGRPLGRLGVPVALVVGSLAPDLAYFLPLSVSRAQSHSLGGLLWFCLPVGLVTYAVFHWWIAPLATLFAPTALRRRLPGEWLDGTLPARSLAGIVVSLLVGALTHLLWDSFTHGSGAVVHAAPWLASVLVTWEGYTLFGFKLLQHSSTLLGLGLLGLWSARWLRAAPVRELELPPPWALRVLGAGAILVPAVGIGVVAGWRRTNAADGLLHQLQLFAGGAVFSGGRAAVAGLLVVALAWRLLRAPLRAEA